MNKMTMKLMGWLIVTACSLLPLTLHAQDQSVSGNLAVSGTIDMSGNGLYLGTHTGGTSGWMMSFTDGTTSAVNFDATTAANLWQWQQNAGGTLALQMSLSGSNTLTLFDQSSTPAAKVMLNPLGTSTFANSVTVNGTDNQMPNQALTGASSVLTEGLADGRYLSGNPSTLAFAGCNATGGNSIATGYSTLASGPYSVAMGYGSVASGENSFSVAYGNASGTGAVALGGASRGNGSLSSGNSTASADWTVSMGCGNYASQQGAVALGLQNTASGTWSLAAGCSTTSSGSGSVALGIQTVASGDLSFAMGGASVASGTASVAMGNAFASGYGSIALGDNARTSNEVSVALGYFTTASGYATTAMGVGTSATGDYAAAMGYNTTAAGQHTTTMGISTLAQAYDSVALGQYNLGNGNATSWIATDPVLEIGNGTDATHLSNALTVYKNGNATHQGTVTAPSFVTTTAAGDIPMFGH